MTNMRSPNEVSASRMVNEARASKLEELVRTEFGMDGEKIEAVGPETPISFFNGVMPAEFMDKKYNDYYLVRVAGVEYLFAFKRLYGRSGTIYPESEPNGI